MHTAHWTTRISELASSITLHHALFSQLVTGIKKEKRKDNLRTAHQSSVSYRQIRGGGQLHGQQWEGGEGRRAGEVRTKREKRSVFDLRVWLILHSCRGTSVSCSPSVRGRSTLAAPHLLSPLPSPLLLSASAGLSLQQLILAPSLTSPMWKGQIHFQIQTGQIWK